MPAYTYLFQTFSTILLTCLHFLLSNSSLQVFLGKSYKQKINFFERFHSVSQPAIPLEKHRKTQPYACNHHWKLLDYGNSLQQRSSELAAKAITLSFLCFVVVVV